MDRWKDKVAVVTGVSSGIGYAVARRLANNGMIVAGCARRMEKMQELQKECPPGKFHPFQADLCNESEIKAFFKFVDDKLGRVDVLINNAGVTRMTSMIDASSEGMKTMFKLNVLAPVFCTREALAIMEKRDIKNGYIMFNNSIHGHKVEHQKKDGSGKLKAIYPYEATKHALKVLAEGLRQELRAKGSKIRVGNVSPGAVETEIEDSMPARDKNHAYKKETLDQELDDRGEAYMMAPDDMADAFVFMLQMPERCDVNEIIVQHMPKAAMK